MKFRVFVGLGTKMSRFQYCYSLRWLCFWGRGAKWALSLELITCPSFAYPVFEFWTFHGVYHIQHDVLIFKILLLLLLLYFFSSLTHKYEKTKQYKARDYFKLLSPGLIIMVDRSEIIISFHMPCEDGCTMCKFKTNLGTQITQTSVGLFSVFGQVWIWFKE